MAIIRRRGRNRSGRRTTSRMGKSWKGKAAKFKTWAKSKKGRRTLLFGGAAAIGAYLLYQSWGGADAQVSLSEQLAPVPVNAGEAAQATSYRIIANRRSGMTYDAATGTPGPQSPISFTPSVSGLFTRNYVQEGNTLWAEIKAS